mmetsp:Transcript_34062/g.85420  ORF Transcript_34062/g.85420 Transcript_34062/m.85420 type:complete len:247 (+) Transcript_34062:119-859(+)
MAGAYAQICQQICQQIRHARTLTCGSCDTRNRTAYARPGLVHVGDGVMLAIELHGVETSLLRTTFWELPWAGRCKHESRALLSAALRVDRASRIPPCSSIASSIGRPPRVLGAPGARCDFCCFFLATSVITALALVASFCTVASTSTFMKTAASSNDTQSATTNRPMSIAGGFSNHILTSAHREASSRPVCTTCASTLMRKSSSALWYRRRPSALAASRSRLRLSATALARALALEGSASICECKR